MIKEAKKIYFVGIGGIGISALARILRAEGKEVAGSDLAASEITEDLSNEGIKVDIGHKKENISRGTSLLIYSAAVPTDNPERVSAEDGGIPQLSYPEALGEYASDKKVIAVAGTNGKTTTTAMLAAILEQHRLDPIALVGSKVLAWNSNARFGQGKYFVLEADEYRRAFLNYSPDIAIITNIEPDHLDYFKDFDDIKQAFREFISKIKPDGVLIYNFDDPVAKELAHGAKVKKISFGHTDLAENTPKIILPGVELQTPGEHNKENALAAASAARAVGASRLSIMDGLNAFSGTWRRFQRLGKLGITEIISDYAHHPRGIEVTLRTMHDEYAGKRILAVFQPHQHNRTKQLFAEFVKSFCASQITNFVIAEIFDVAGREETADQDVSSEDLVREIRKCGKEAAYAKDLAQAEEIVRDLAPVTDAVIIMGAGDIYQVADNLVK